MCIERWDMEDGRMSDKALNAIMIVFIAATVWAIFMFTYLMLRESDRRDVEMQLRYGTTEEVKP